MQTITDAYNTLSNDFQRHPIVALCICVAHIIGAIFFSSLSTIYTLHIPQIITETLQNICYLGGICVSYITLYPVIKKQFKKK